MAMFDFFTILVKKELVRGNFLEALNYYHQNIMQPIAKLARIYFEPTKKGFNLKHIKRDLPSDLVKSIEDLYAVSSLNDIQIKLNKAIEFMHIMEKSNRIC